MQQCNYCKFWDYELAENVGRPFPEARGVCTKSLTNGLITAGTSSCNSFEPYPDTFLEKEALASNKGGTG